MFSACESFLFCNLVKSSHPSAHNNFKHYLSSNIQQDDEKRKTMKMHFKNVIYSDKFSSSSAVCTILKCDKIFMARWCKKFSIYENDGWGKKEIYVVELLR